jgi:two-component sensor histidine kinase
LVSLACAWAVDQEENHLKITWSERGGPEVKKPSRRGFGTVVIERLAASVVNGEANLRYDPTGLVWTLIAKDVFASADNFSGPNVQPGNERPAALSQST